MIDSSRHFSSVLFGVLLPLALVVGCAATQEVEESAAVVWPLPPQPARIRFERAFKEDRDVLPPPTFWQKLGNLFGGEKAKIHLRKPFAVFGDARGRVFVGDTGWGRLEVFDPEAKTFEQWGIRGPGTLQRPAGITGDRAGQIYVADGAQARVVVFSPEGKFVTAYGEAGDLKRPSGIALDEARGRLYVADTKAHAIAIFELGNPRKKESIGKRGMGPGEFNFPTHLAIDQGGKLYVMDTFNFRVQVFGPDKRFIRTFGKNCDVAGCMPRGKGIGIDSDGHVYVVDAAFNLVQIFDPEGKLLLAFGGQGVTPGKLSLPAGLHVDANNRILVADQYNYRVSRYQYVSEAEAARGAPEVEGAEGAAGTQEAKPGTPTPTPDETPPVPDEAVKPRATVPSGDPALAPPEAPAEAQAPDVDQAG